MQSHNLLHTITIAEYLLLIEPRKDLTDSITDIKKYFHNKFQSPEATKGRPHITLAKFTQYTSFEDRIVHKLRSLSLSKAPFPIDLLDFGSFPSHTIYINILSRPAIQSLVKCIRTEAQSLMKMDNDNKPHFIMEPHLTISRKLKPWQYEQAWLEFSHKNFTGKFIATNMLLLKKEADAGRYEPVERFEFQDIPAFARQAALF